MFPSVPSSDIVDSLSDHSIGGGTPSEPRCMLWSPLHSSPNVLFVTRAEVGWWKTNLPCINPAFTICTSVTSVPCAELFFSGWQLPGRPALHVAESIVQELQVIGQGCRRISPFSCLARVESTCSSSQAEREDLISEPVIHRNAWNLSQCLSSCDCNTSLPT